MKLQRYTDIGLKACAALLLAVAFALTFTVSDYYIFNRVGQYDFMFVFSQWVKKAGLLLLPLAVYYNKRCCADIAKYFLPLFVIISCFAYGDFFNATAISAESTPAELVYSHINEFMPKEANMALFFISNALYLVICAGLFMRDGFTVNAKSFAWLPLAMLACMPLNIFENFFDINDFSPESFLWFKSFTVWHLLAVLVLAGFTVLCYFFLRNKDKTAQEHFLAAAAIVLLIQYHSKDSVIMGDGYNVYHTIFACVPLFICNIGVYVAALSVFTKKRIFYSISFFVHAAGAISVFVYFGKDDISNYGIFCSYSILYFCLTHCILFALSVLPAALGHYRFRIKDCIIPLVYYLAVVIIAAVASALVTSASMDFSFNGYTLSDGEWLQPNYAFTQENPLPFTVPMWKLTIWRYDLNMLYILGLYAVYAGIFWSFNGLYYLFLLIRRKALAGKRKSTERLPEELPALQAESAATKDEED